jgi:hypothetical protein
MRLSGGSVPSATHKMLITLHDPPVQWYLKSTGTWLCPAPVPSFIQLLKALAAIAPADVVERVVSALYH